MLSSPLDDPRVEALVAWAAGDERPDVAAALASLKDAAPRPECATALGGVAVKAFERVPRVGARDEPLGNAVVAVLAGWAPPGRSSSNGCGRGPAACALARGSRPR